MLKSYPYRTLVGGRRVRDYSGLTVAELVNAVGDDPEHAKLALEQEQESPSPRKTAIKKLEAVAETAEDESLG